MKSMFVQRSLLVLVLAGALGIGGYWAQSAWRKTPAEPHTSMRPHTPHPDSALSADSPSADEAIVFPRESWDAARLRVQTVSRAPLEEAIELTGKVTLNEDRLAHVFPLVEGRVNEVRVQFGQQVKKGDLLVVVQSKEVGQGMLQLFQDRLRLEFAQSKDRWTQDVGRNAQAMITAMRDEVTVENIEQALKDRPLGDYREKLMTSYVAYLKSKAHVERLSPISQSGAVPARQVMEAKAELDANHATLLSLWEQIAQDTLQATRLSAQTIKELQTSIAVAETNLKILGVSAHELKSIDPVVQGEQLAHYPVTAPFDGTVISKDVVLLERVGPQQQILAIADLSTVWLTADIYETHLPLLAKLHDQRLRFRCAAWPDRDFEAQVFYTGDLVQETTRTIALRAKSENPDRLLKPGMFVTVILPSLQTEDTLQVPLTAIQDHEGVSFVFVQTGEEEFLRRNVILGRRNDQSVEVRSGLEAGERVAVDGGFALKSKMLADLLAE